MKLSVAICFFVVVSRAVSEESSNGPHDMLAMLQSSVQVKQNSNTTSLMSGSENGHGGPDTESVSHLEEMLVNKIRDGSLKGDTKVAAVINASIKNMYMAIISATGSNQKLIKKSIQAFKRCKFKMWKNYAKALPLEKNYQIYEEIYPKCIHAEKKLKLQHDLVMQKYELAKDVYDTNKQLMTVQGRTCINVCTNHRNENYHEQLRRLARYYTKCKKKLGPLKRDMEQAKKIYIKEHKKHWKSGAKYKAMKKKCFKIAFLMNREKCQSVTKLQTGCKGYGQCWKIALRNYKQNADMVRTQEKNMKIEWRALKRIQCYLKVVDDKPVKDKKGKVVPENMILDGCIKMKRPGTKHLNIDYGKIPKKPKCPLDKMCPCTSFYVNTAFHVGPKMRCASNKIRRYRCKACRSKQ